MRQQCSALFSVSVKHPVNTFVGMLRWWKTWYSKINDYWIRSFRNIRLSLMLWDSFLSLRECAMGYRRSEKALIACIAAQSDLHSCMGDSRFQLYESFLAVWWLKTRTYFEHWTCYHGNLNRLPCIKHLIALWTLAHCNTSATKTEGANSTVSPTSESEVYVYIYLLKNYERDDQK